MTPDFVQIDAFSTRPLYGNPAAVVFDADDIPSDLMQKIAREMNLSETVFVLKPTSDAADYRVRIFTPMSELPFAGHPTVATAHAMLDRHPALQQQSVLRQECGIGIVPVEVLPTTEGRLLRMTQAPAKFTDTPLTPATIARMLGCEEDEVCATPAQVVSTGVPWLIAQVRGLDVIANLAPDQNLIASECRALRAAGITVFAELAEGPQRIRVRTFAPGEGVAEDPVCGSGNGCVAAYVARHIDPANTGAYRAEQGIEIGRDGIIHASWTRENGEIVVKIGGAAATSARGQLVLE